MSELFEALCDELPNGLTDHEKAMMVIANTSEDTYGLIRHPDLPECLLDGFNWQIGDCLDQIKVFDSDVFVQDSEGLDKFLDTVFLKGYQYTRIYIIVEIGRTLYSDRQEMIEIAIPCTPRQILEAVSTVYQRPATADFVETLRQINDSHGHASEEVLQMLKQGEDARNHHLQGGLTYYEGFVKLSGNNRSGNVYALSLGS
jgi:hypothetical protein